MNRDKFHSFVYIPAVTKNLIIINVLLWMMTVIMSRLDLTEWLGLHYPAAKGFRFYQLITYMFMHGSLVHLFLNMFGIYMFGRVLESVWGPRRFLFYFMITGIGAGLVQLLVTHLRVLSMEGGLDADTIALVYEEGGAVLKEGKNYMNDLLGKFNSLVNVTTVGASGAVFGILLAFGMLFPNIPLYIVPFPFPVRAKYLVTGYGVIELFTGIANFSFDHVAHFAHLGGMFFGIGLILYWRKRDRDEGNCVY
jgi:membrane associated rhomboid family serine protease